MLGFEASSTRVSDSLGVCGGADNIDDEVGLRQHCDVTAVDSMSGRTHALRYEALQIGVDCLVLRGQNVPARFGLPGRAFHFLVEEVSSRRVVRRPDDLLLLLGKVAREILRAVGEHPNAPVRRRNVLQQIRVALLEQPQQPQ